MTRTLHLTCLVVLLAISGIWGEKDKPCSRCQGDPCCYGDVGCFPARSQCGEDPKDPLDLYPRPPCEIITTFLLYDKYNVSMATEMKRTFPAKLFLDNEFNPKIDTKIIVHGVLSPNFYGSLLHIKEQFFAKGFNIFMVNWQANVDTGSVDKDGILQTYRKPYEDTRVVGKELGMFLKHLHRLFGVSYGSMHIVGHNLGAHIAGYAGKYIRDEENDKISQITALAPAAPFVELSDGTLRPPECRLDKADAQFVDVINADKPSDAKITMGVDVQIGHVDFYANDGEDPQPGCNYMFCSHNRPIDLYEQSIAGKCKFQSEPCTKTTSCPPEGCPVMGYNVNANAQGFYCVLTTNKEPFCKEEPVTID